MVHRDAFSAQRGRLLLWVPVALSCGIGLYFELRIEPDGRSLFLIAALGLFCFVGGVLFRRFGPVWIFLGLALSGVLLASFRTHYVAAPVLKYRAYGAVEGRLIRSDRSISDAPRLTLDRVKIEDVPIERTPERVRISLHGDQVQAIATGSLVRLQASLSPPSGPVEPGGFDFQRYAWFMKLGAVGYTKKPVEILSGPSRDLPISRIRSALSAFLQKSVKGDPGAFAAAILVGDRSKVTRDRLQDLRRSNLAHLLAISGLHMGLLTGFVFAVLRRNLSVWPSVGLRLQAKKLSAVIALGVAAIYLALSGGNIATQRAFIMVAVMLVAVLLDRRAITLRSVALAAIIVLVLEPESLAEPGFQMSFAATTALVAVFSATRNWPEAWRRPPKCLQPALAMVLSSLIAGLATAPFGAAHFNQVAQFGLLANVLAVPVMGLVVVPMAVLGMLLAPLGLEAIGFVPMGWAIEWILFIANWVAGLDGSVWPMKSPDKAVLPILALGSLWCLLWQGTARVIGVLPVLVSFWLWGQTERPEMLVSETAGVFGVMTPTGRVVSKPKGDGFAARSWLENDGDLADQVTSFERLSFMQPSGWQMATIGESRFALVRGRGWKDRLDPACASSDWLIVPQWLKIPPEGGCELLDRRAMRRTGAIAIYTRDGKTEFLAVNDLRGRRPWVQ